MTSMGHSFSHVLIFSYENGTSSFHKNWQYKLIKLALGGSHVMFTGKFYSVIYCFYHFRQISNSNEPLIFRL